MTPAHEWTGEERVTTTEVVRDKRDNIVSTTQTERDK